MNKIEEEKEMITSHKIIFGLSSGIGTAMIPVTAFASDDSLGSLMKQAGFNTILGIGTVFIMLVIISLIIYCFRFIPKLQKAFSRKKTVEEEPMQVNQAALAFHGTAPTAASEGSDDLELVAVIAAAIAASEQVPIDSFVVRTIKRRV